MPVPEIVKLNAATYLQGADPAKPTAAPIGDLVSLIQARSVQVDEGRFGIWISSPGRWHRQITSAEFCFFLEGECTFTPDGGEPIEIRAGDVLHFPADSLGVWDIRTDCRKVYFIFDSATVRS